MRYELHPLCTLFPRMPERDFAALRDDIAANGLRQSIVLHGGMILDGGNRYRACLDAGVEPTFAELDGDDIGSFVLSANLHRRHLSPGQHAAIVASVTNWSRAAAHGGGRRGVQEVSIPLETVAQRAAQAGVGESTQKKADKVAKADPALAKQVARGEVSLPAAVKRVSKPAAPKSVDTEVLRLKQKVSSLEDDLARKDADLMTAEDAAEQAVETARSLQSIADGQEAKRMEVLSQKLRLSEANVSRLMNENAALKAEVKRLRRSLAKYEGEQ